MKVIRLHWRDGTSPDLCLLQTGNGQLSTASELFATTPTIEDSTSSRSITYFMDIGAPSTTELASRMMDWAEWKRQYPYESHTWH